MGAEHCFEQAGINDGGVAYIAAEFAAHSHELSVKANVPALAQGTKRDALETCIQKSINSMGKYWGGSKRPSNWNPNDTKKVCSLNYRITQTYEYKEHPRRWQDGPWQVRRPGDYQLKTYNLKTEEPCDAAAVATAIKPHFEKIKSCLSHAGRGLFGRHHYTFYINERGGMTASPARETNPKKSSQARRQAYRKQMREGMKKCQNAEDKKSCRDQLKVRLQRFLKSKNAGSTGPNGEGETNPRLGQVKAQCLGLPLQGSRYKDALGRAFKPHIKGTRRASSRRSPKPPKTVCRVDWQFEHTRSKAP
ncbi:MAG: hypothetical protein CMH55_09015 [Myxococcales bacterium]|nr:hypothetical protein [Myxococcales bacterium]